METTGTRDYAKHVQMLEFGTRNDAPDTFCVISCVQTTYFRAQQGNRRRLKAGYLGT